MKSNVGVETDPTQNRLDLVEPDPAVLSCFDRSQIPQLSSLFEKPSGRNDLERYRQSARALYVLSWLMRPDELTPLVQKASVSPNILMWRAAAVCAARLPAKDAVALLTRLLQEKEVSVVRVAAQSIPRSLLVELRPALDKARASAPIGSYLRKVLDNILRDIPKEKR